MARYEAVLVARIPNEIGDPTLTEVCGLKWSGLSYEDDAGGIGRIDIGVPMRDLPADAKTRLRDMIAYPSELWIHRDGIRVAAGPLTSWNIQGRTITLYAPSLLGYLNYWVWTDDTVYEADDQATIVAAIIDTKQNLTYGSFGLSTAGLTATGVTRDLTLQAREQRNVLKVVQEMGARENGYDLAVDPATRAVMLYTPRRGVDRSGDIFLDRRNIASPEAFASVAPGQVATDVYGASSSADGAALTSHAENPTVRTTFGRADVGGSWHDIKIQSTLDDHTARMASDLSTMRVSVSPRLVPVEGAGVADFDAGDLVTYSYDAGLGTLVSVQRVRTKQVSVSGARAKEQIAVRFI